MSITGGSGALLGDGVEASVLNGDGGVVAGRVEISATRVIGRLVKEGGVISVAGASEMLLFGKTNEELDELSFRSSNIEEYMSMGPSRTLLGLVEEPRAFH